MKPIIFFFSILALSLFIFGCTQQEHAIPNLPEPKPPGWEEEWQQNVIQLEATNLDEYYNQIYTRCIESRPQDTCEYMIDNAKKHEFRINLDSKISPYTCPKDYLEVKHLITFGYKWCKPVPEEVVSKTANIISNHYLDLNQYIELKDIGKIDNEYRVTYTFSMPNLYSEIIFYVDETGNLAEREIDSLIDCTEEDINCPPFIFNKSDIISLFQQNDFVSCTLDYTGTVLLEEDLYNGYAYSIQYNCKENCVIPREIKGYDPECKTAYVNPFDGTVLKENIE